MFPAQTIPIKPDELSRCEERQQPMEHGKTLSKTQKTDAAIKESVERAIWQDDVLRALEYHEIAVRVKNGVVYLNGHIVSTTSQGRVETALRGIPGILGIQNNLILDDKLTNDVAILLGNLEHTYDCKFFTGASHGVISLNGIVSGKHVKGLAEQSVVAHPGVRGVLNNLRVSGDKSELQDGPFLQPMIGEIIHFLDGISGIVKQVVIDPHNRRVVAMILQGQFADPRQALKSVNSAEARSPERLVVLAMDLVRYLTRASGFLTINSNERERYLDFDPASFRAPPVDWTPPYPYCPDDVLFPLETPAAGQQTLDGSAGSALTVALDEQLLWEQLLANDSLGG